VPHRNWEIRIHDILTAVNSIQSYTKEMDFSSFKSDRRTVDAVIRNLIVIGEAASHMPEEICQKYPEIPWYEMRGMRNFVVHEYFVVSDKILWDTIHIDLKELPKSLKRIIKSG